MAKHTCRDERAVAGPAGTVVPVGSHHHGVLLSAVQVVPGAEGVVGLAQVGVAVQPSRRSRVRPGAVA